MKSIEHKIQHYLQPTNSSCGYAALAMLLSFYDAKVSPEDILKAVPIIKNEQEEDLGSLSPELATWILGRDYAVDLYTFDFQIIDLSWANLSRDKVIERLETVKNIRNVPSLGRNMSERFIQSYIDFLRAGGNLRIKQNPTSELLINLLRKAPIFVNVSSHPLYNLGRLSYPEPGKNTADDVNGKITTHSLVIYGVTSDGNFLLADPWEGLSEVEPEVLLCGIMGAQIECDTMCFQVFEKGS